MFFDTGLKDEKNFKNSSFDPGLNSGVLRYIFTQSARFLF